MRAETRGRGGGGTRPTASATPARFTMPVRVTLEESWGRRAGLRARARQQAARVERAQVASRERRLAAGGRPELAPDTGPARAATEAVRPAAGAGARTTRVPARAVSPPTADTAAPVDRAPLVQAPADQAPAGTVPAELTRADQAPAATALAERAPEELTPVE